MKNIKNTIFNEFSSNCLFDPVANNNVFDFLRFIATTPLSEKPAAGAMVFTGKSCSRCRFFTLPFSHCLWGVTFWRLTGGHFSINRHFALLYKLQITRLKSGCSCRVFDLRFRSCVWRLYINAKQPRLRVDFRGRTAALCALLQVFGLSAGLGI